MAGDWMKVQHATPDKPEIFEIAQILDLDSDAVFGKCFRVWAWFDKHTECGKAPILCQPCLDRIAGEEGFVSAMAAVGLIDFCNEHMEVAS